MGPRLRLGPWADYAAYALLTWILYREATFYFFPYKTALARYRRKPRAYAVITGASGGIGYGFAQELVSRGFGVILLANNEDKLARMAEKLKAENVDAVVETVSFDVRGDDYASLDGLMKPYVDLPITVLVNNVGGPILERRYEVLSQFTAHEADAVMNANARFMTHLTRLLIPTLVRNGPSVAIHLSSGARVGMARGVIYSGCKAYVASFATALAREAKMEGWKLDSVGIVLADVYSQGNTTNLGPGSPQSRPFAKMVLDRIEMAVDRGLSLITPYWLHALQIMCLEKLPEGVVQSMMQSSLRERMAAMVKGD